MWDVASVKVRRFLDNGDMRPDSDIDILVEFQSSARIEIIKFVSLSEEQRARPHVLRVAQLCPCGVIRSSG